MIRLTSPDMVCLIIIPISTSIRDVPYPAITPSNPHPKAAINAISIPIIISLFISPPVTLVLPIIRLAITQVITPAIILELSSCLNIILPSTAPIAGQRADIGMTIDPAF